MARYLRPSRTICSEPRGHKMIRFPAISCYFANLPGDRSMAREIRRQEDRVRAQTLGSNSRHGRTHTELSRFIRSSTHYGAIPAPRHNDRLSAQLRIGSVEWLPEQANGSHGVYAEENGFCLRVERPEFIFGASSSTMNSHGSRRTRKWLCYDAFERRALNASWRS
jgi:hypothetical protein